MRHAGRQALTRVGSVAEITSAVPLCTPKGQLNPAAVGWSRRPLHTANLRGWGRTKRFDYWGIVTPDVIVGLTIASLDYAGHVSIVVVDRRTGSETILSGLPIRRAPNDFEQVIAAARLKAEYPLSYADCFVVATAVREGAIVLTGDPEFKSVESVVPIEWLGDQPVRTARRRPRV